MTASAVEARIARWTGEYTPEIETQLRAARESIRALFPAGFELVFDNYNALVFGISPSDRTRDSFISIAGYPKWVTLFFLNGVDLHDPDGLLEGQGKQVRSVRLGAASDLARSPVQALIAQAVEPHAAALEAAPPLTTIIKFEATRRRPRRPT